MLCIYYCYVNYINILLNLIFRKFKEIRDLTSSERTAILLKKKGRGNG